MTDQQSLKPAKAESPLARRAWVFLAIGIAMVAIGLVISESIGGVVVGVFNLAALVFVVLGIIGLVGKLTRR